MSHSLVIVPTLNESANVGRLIPRLGALDGVDILVVDDSSPDGTADIVETLRDCYPQLSLLRRESKKGLGRAYVAGIQEVLRRGYERVVTMDADLSHAPEDVPRLLAALDHAEVAIGSRYVRGGTVTGWPLLRRLLSRLAGTYTRLLLRIAAADVTSGFRAYLPERCSPRARLGEEVRSTGFVFQVEVLRPLLDLPGTRLVEAPIRFRDRSEGKECFRW